MKSVFELNCNTSFGIPAIIRIYFCGVKYEYYYLLKNLKIFHDNSILMSLCFVTSSLANLQ